MPNVDAIIINAIYMFIIFGIPAIIIIFAYNHLNKQNQKVKDFKEQKLKTTFFNELKKKTNQFGVSTKKFKMIRDFQIVGHPRKYMMIDVEMPKYTINPKTNEVETSEETVKTRFIIIKSGNKNMLLRFFLLRDNYFFIELKDGYEGILKIDSEKKRFCIQGLIDFETFGDVWIMSEGSHEYLSNISIKRMLEQNIMHSENMTDRAVHYDIQQAKLERRDRIITDLEKSKYEDRKNMGDSTIV